MTSYVILSGSDVVTLTKDKPVVIYIDGKPHTLCTDEYFEKETGVKMNRADMEGGMTNGDMIKAVFPGCEDWKATIKPATGEAHDTHFVQLPNNMTINKVDESWWNAPYKRTEG